MRLVCERPIVAGWRLACAETSASAMELDSFHCSEGTIRSVAGATAGGGKSESESKGECDESAFIPRNTFSLGGVVVPHRNSGETAPGPEWVCEADMITLARGTVKPLDTAMAYAMSITLLCTLSHACVSDKSLHGSCVIVRRACRRHQSCRE